MIARIWLPGVEVESKQHSRSYTRTGRTFTNTQYASARRAIGLMVLVELRKQKWFEPVECKCSMILSYRGRFDLDNAAGFIMDALQGIAYVRDSQIISIHIRKRLKGPMGVKIFIRTLEVK